MSMDREIWVSPDGKQFWENVHPRLACQGRNCVLHNPSDHHMRSWPIHLRESGLVERICPHGIGHPDPDSAAYFKGVLLMHGVDVHGCDGCCHAEPYIEGAS